MLVATTDACWDQDGSLCRWVYERTDGNATLANLSDWFVDKPFRIVVIVVVASIATWITRRWIRRIVAGMVAPKVPPVERLERLGIDVPDKFEPQPSVRREARAHSVSVLLTSTLVATIWVIAVLMILGVVGVDLAPLIAGAGVAGVALGFGAQTLVRDFISGLFMMLEDQYGIGDVVDLGEATGVVEDVSLRTTVLRGLDGTVWHVPNGVVERVGNQSQLWSVAVVDVDVAYDADLAASKSVLLEAANDVCDDEEFADKIYERPQVLGVEALAADGITMRLIIRVQPGSQWMIQRAVRERLKAKFDAAGIEIPFPQRTVWMRADPVAAASDGGGAPEQGGP